MTSAMSEDFAWMDDSAPAAAADDFDWLDLGDDAARIETARVPNETNRAQIMQAGAMLGKDRVWFTDGDYIWFRRKKANPATLQRHNRFTAAGDYEHIGTHDDVEVYKLKPQSVFATKRELNISELDDYNIRRQAAIAAVKRQWETFQDIMSYLRERVNARYQDPQRPGAPTPFAEQIYAELYAGIMHSIAMRHGPSPQEINRELMALAARKGQTQKRIITLGR